MSWRAGAAAAAIDVPVGTSLAGYGARTVGATGTASQLEATILSLTVREKRSLLLTLDLLCVERDWVAMLRSELIKEIGHVTLLVAASHTHSGPAGFRTRCGVVENARTSSEIREVVIACALQAANKAVAAESDAKLRLGRSSVAGVAANRTDSRIPVDDTLSVLLVDGAAHPIARLWHFACHPTLLGPDNRQVSPDLPGRVRDLWRAATGMDLPVLYLNGAAADVSTRFTRTEQTFQELDRMARRIVEAEPRDMIDIAPSPPRSATTKVRLPGASFDEGDARARLVQAEAILAGLEQEAASGPEVARQRARLIGTRKRLARAATPCSEDVEVELHALALGELVFVGVPGELYASSGLQLTRAFPQMAVLPVGYCQDYIGYLPPEGAEGYEADSALVAPGAADLLVPEAIRLVERLA